MIYIPGYKGHLVFAAFFLVAVILFSEFIYAIIPSQTWWWYLLYSPIILFYAILSDADTPASKSRFIISFIGLGLIICLSLFQAIKGFSLRYTIFITLLGIGLFIPLFLKHRGFLHSFAAGILLSLPLLLLSWQLTIMGILAYWSHLIIDFVMTFIDRGHVRIRLL